MTIKLLESYENGISLIPASEKYKEPLKSEKDSWDNVNRAISNSIVVKNSLIIDEIKEMVTEQLAVNVSNSKFCRKLHGNN